MKIYKIHWQVQAGGVVEVEAESESDAMEAFNNIEYDRLIGGENVVTSDSDWEIWAEQEDDEEDEDE